MPDKKDDKKDEKKGGMAHDVEDLDYRVSHLEAAIGSSYHPTEEELAEQEEAAAKEREKQAEEAEKEAAKAAKENEKLAEEAASPS